MAVDLGDAIRLTFTNYSPGGGLVDATTMTVTITTPDGVIGTPVTVVSSPTGTYNYTYTTVQAGRHAVRWLGTGTNPGAHTDVFDVREAVPPLIISMSDAKEQLNITGSGSDEELRVFVEASTLMVERIRGEAIVRRTITEQHCAYGSFALNWPPLISLTSVASTDGLITWNVADLLVSPAGVVSSKQGLNLYGDLTAVYVAGYVVVPADFQLAGRIILQHLWETQRGTKGPVRPGGAEAIVISSGYAVPNRAKDLLGLGTGGFA